MAYFEGVVSVQRASQERTLSKAKNWLQINFSWCNYDKIDDIYMVVILNGQLHFTSIYNCTTKYNTFFLYIKLDYFGIYFQPKSYISVFILDSGNSLYPVFEMLYFNIGRDRYYTIVHKLNRVFFPGVGNMQDVLWDGNRIGKNNNQIDFSVQKILNSSCIYILLHTQLKIEVQFFFLTCKKQI